MGRVQAVGDGPRLAQGFAAPGWSKEETSPASFPCGGHCSQRPPFHCLPDCLVWDGRCLSVQAEGVLVFSAATAFVEQF